MCIRDSILKGAGLENPDEWQVSMDKEHWTIPESAVMYNKPGVLPDAPQDMKMCIRDSISPEVYFTEATHIQASADNLYSDILPSHGTGNTYGI